MVDFVLGAVHQAGDRAVVLAGEQLGTSAEDAWAIAASAGARFGYVTRRAGDRGALRGGVHPTLLPGGRRVDVPEERGEVEAVWGPIRAEEPGRDATGILYACADREIDVLFVIGVDPLTDFPDAALARRALENVETVVVQGLELGDLAPFASVFLPAVPPVEREGHLTTWEGRGQRVRPVRESAGLSRPDWEIFASLALALGGDLGFETLEEIREEMAPLLAPRTASVARTDRPTPAIPDLELWSAPLLIDEGRLSIGADELKAALQEDAVAEMHPDTAAAAGLADADAVLLRTAAGEARLPLLITPHVAPGVVFVPYANPGLRANTLLSGAFTAHVRVEAVRTDDALEPAAAGGEA
jgi:NADH-quinone oxidoreductase subunit G